MNTINHMNKQEFEYSLNAMLYCLWLFEQKSQYIISKIIRFLFSPIPKYFFPKKIKERYYENKRKSKRQVNDFFNNKKNGLSIRLARHNFDYLYSSFPCFISFSLLGLILRIFKDINLGVLFMLFIIPITIFSIPMYKAVFSNDKYLEYFKLFEKEDEHWHKLWKRRTKAFIFGSITSFFLGIIMAFVIAMN